MDARVVQLAALCTLFPITGCVLSGPLQIVGRYQVQGRLSDADGHGLPDQDIILLQPHAGRIDKEMIHLLARPPEINAAETQIVSIRTEAHGEFAHEFQGFKHCHPFWVFPPLFELPCYVSGAIRHGEFFLLKTPEPNGHIYEIEVGEASSKIRVVDPQSAKRRKLKPGRETLAGITIQPQSISVSSDSPTGTNNFSIVRLEVKRPHSNE